MFPFPVVIDLNILEYGRQGVMMPLKTLMMNHLRLDDAEKRLGNCVVPAVTLTTHTLDEPMLVEHLPEIFTGILNTTIRMDDQSFSRSAALDCSMKRRLDHLASQRTAECPSHINNA